MSDLKHLYQELVLDHGRNPRNLRGMHDCEGASGCSHREGFNPLCGDKLKLYVKHSEGTLDDLSFEGDGCAIFTASSSMLTEALKGKSLDEVKAILEEFIEMLTNQDAVPHPDGLGKLAVFSGVKDFPARVKCATLPWRALEAILESQGQNLDQSGPAISSDHDDTQE